MKRIPLIFLFIFFLTGCAKFSHLSQLLVLKEYSDNGEHQNQFVLEQDKHFEKILIAAKKQELNQYPNKESIQKAFGEPIVAYPVKFEGKEYEMWIYRYSVKFFDSEKVYLYFDQAGSLNFWKHTLPQEQTNSEES